MLEMIGKFVNHVKRFGLARTLRKIGLELAIRAGDVNFVVDRRRELSADLDRRFHSTVAYGPFKGFRFAAESWWSSIDRAGMLLGLYEQEVLTEIAALKGLHATFIDIGAADGYYGVACVSQGIFENSHCFEISELGQKVIAETARLNGVADKVHVHGKADADVLSGLPAEVLESCVVLVDIEGAEFDVLTPRVLELLKSAVILIELHEWMVPDPQGALAGLEQRVRAHFDITRLTMGARNPGAFPELEDMSDSDRWLICAEGRPRLQAWWKLTPRERSGLAG